MNLKTLLAVVAVGTATFTTARMTAEPAPQDGFDMEAMMEAMRLAQPGPEHEELAKMLSGEWETDVSVKGMGPDSTPMKTNGTESAVAILDGRFIEVTSQGAFMGQPFESRSFIGYDRRHEQFTSVGMDTLGTYWVTATGKRDADGVIRMKGEDDDPAGKQVYTFEYETISEDEREFRVIFSQIGGQVYEEPFTMVTVRSRRKR